MTDPYIYMESLMKSTKDPMNSMVLVPGDLEYINGKYSGTSQQIIETNETKLVLCSIWNQGKREGIAFVKDLSGENYMSVHFEDGVIDGSLILRTRTRIYTFEYIEGVPTGNVSYVEPERNVRFKGFYSQASVVSRADLFEGNVCVCQGNITTQIIQKYGLVSIPFIKTLSNGQRSQKRISPVMQIPSGNVNYNQSDYNQSYSKRAYYSIIALISRTFSSSRDKTAENEVLVADSYITDFDEYIATNNSVKDELKRIWDKYSKVVKKREGEEKKTQKDVEKRRQEIQREKEMREKEQMLEKQRAEFAQLAASRRIQQLAEQMKRETDARVRREAEERAKSEAEAKTRNEMEIKERNETEARARGKANERQKIEAYQALREATERAAEERAAKERATKERATKEREAKEREAKEREAKEREAKEMRGQKYLQHQVIVLETDDFLDISEEEMAPVKTRRRRHEKKRVIELETDDLLIFGDEEDTKCEDHGKEEEKTKKRGKLTKQLNSERVNANREDHELNNLKVRRKR